MIGLIFRKIFGSRNDREVKRLRPLVARINQIAIHPHTHRAPGGNPFKARLWKNPVKPLGFGLRFHQGRAGSHKPRHLCAAAFDDSSGKAQVFGHQLGPDPALRPFQRPKHRQKRLLDQNADDIVGIVYLKDIVRRVFEHRDAEQSERVESIMRVPYFVPDSKAGELVFLAL